MMGAGVDWDGVDAQLPMPPAPGDRLDVDESATSR